MRQSLFLSQMADEHGHGKLLQVDGIVELNSQLHQELSQYLVKQAREVEWPITAPNSSIHSFIKYFTSLFFFN